VPPPPAAGSKAPSSPVLAALIVGVILGVLAGVGISVYVYRRKKRKEAQRLLLGGQPSQVASKGLPFLTLNCVEYKIMCICVFMLNLLRFLSCCPLLIDCFVEFRLWFCLDLLLHIDSSCLFFCESSICSL
jgi:hypothetical protein